ncbi:hypothetical protein CI109_100032 [Kwoniella shandongensis]|uniref:chitin deacetylase n=1 Tax=Kwoniella shandongensis TaxID=1734106 RepID=A0AAJ8MTK3_9TREE
MLQATTAVLLALSVGASQALGHAGCGGHDIARRNLGGPIIAAAAVTDEASAASSVDPVEECMYYSYQPVLDVVKNFPTVWQTAAIVPGDDEATALFATINATVNAKYPNVGPKGTHNGDWTLSKNYDAKDPDCWWTHSQCTTPAADSGLKADIVSVPEPETWGLGFDDGPNCSHNALYDYLRDQGQKATMFYIGSNVIDWPLQALRGIDDGHQLCVHTWSHQYMTSMTNEEAFAELYYTRKSIQTVAGVTPMCWRPPYGDVDNRIRLIAESLNLTNIVWSDDTEDWQVGTGGVTQDDVSKNYQLVIDKAGKGTYATHGPVVLNHEINNMTMAEFLTQYDKIKAGFKYVVPIAAAYNWTTPYVETNVTFPDFMTYTNQSSGDSASGSASATDASGSPTAAASGGSASPSGTGSANSSTAAKSAAALGVEVKGAAVWGVAIMLIGRIALSMW